MPPSQSLVAHATHDTPRPLRRVLAVTAAMLVLVAIVLATTLTGPHTIGSAPPAAATHAPYVPLIQYRGTGAPPAPTRRLVTATRPSTGLLRAEHSYGAVP